MLFLTFFSVTPSKVETTAVMITVVPPDVSTEEEIPYGIHFCLMMLSKTFTYFSKVHLLQTIPFSSTSTF